MPIPTLPTLHTPHTLDEIQEQFSRALLQPASAESIAPLFHAHPYQDDRLALYRGNLTAIWTSALKNAFPVLHQLVGEEYFEQLARAFGRACPSVSGDLNQFGAKLPEFLKTIPDAGDYPYFSDIASLEWQVHTAYYAADAVAIGLHEVLQAIAAGGQDVQALQLDFHPAASLYQSAWDSVGIWHAHQAGEAAGFPQDIRLASYALIARREWQVEVQKIDEPGWLALKALQQGRSLGEALELALEADAGFAINASLQSWFFAGLFTQFKFPADKL
ncbi:DNA-binding domain-containing protein [Undibacterium pigrum]|nr:DNA-binding domain-containing protein [Undibacterium pigrum]